MKLLREQDFRNFWLAQSISLFGDQVTVIALPLAAVLVLDADAADMGYLGAAALMPHLILSLPVGVWLERVARRRRLMIAADIARAALLASVPIAYWYEALSFAWPLSSTSPTARSTSPLPRVRTTSRRTRS